jgi:hypothetical protein
MMPVEITPTSPRTVTASPLKFKVSGVIGSEKQTKEELPEDDTSSEFGMCHPYSG